MKNYEMQPYVGVGKARLGMIKSQLSEILGEADSTDIDKSEGEITEYRKSSRITAIYSLADQKLVELGFGPNINELNYHGIKLFAEKPEIVLKKLMGEDNKPLQHVGFIVFFNLGIALAGFLNSDEDEADKAVTVFAKGRWDFIKPKMKPFKFKK